MLILKLGVPVTTYNRTILLYVGFALIFTMGGGSGDIHFLSPKMWIKNVGVSR